MIAPDDRTFGEKVSDLISRFGGSWLFILIGMFCSISWVSLNTLAVFDFLAWDKPLILLNLVLSFVAAFQAPFIMMSQRRCELKQDAAYRCLFREIKELVEKDLDEECQLKREIQGLKAMLVLDEHRLVA